LNVHNRACTVFAGRLDSPAAGFTGFDKRVHDAKRLAERGCNIILVNQAEGFDWETDTVKDHVHPNASGAKKMAAKWMEALLPLIKANEAKNAPKATK
jgi:lysophospholipase L1-like esterase